MPYHTQIGVKYIMPFAFFLACCLFLSCEKPSGEGGTATITGKLYARDYDSEGNLKREYFLPNERVFIIYGDNSIYDDDMRTHLDGTYQFKNLYKGEYTIFAYSKCDTCIAPEVPISQNISITQRGQYINVPLITIRK